MQGIIWGSSMGVLRGILGVVTLPNMKPEAL